MTKHAEKQDDATLPEGSARLFDMETREVSLVDHPANKQRFILVKRADGTQEQVEVVSANVATKATAQLKTAEVGGPHIADQFEVAAPLTAALGQVEKALAGTPAVEETHKMTTPNQPTTLAAPVPAAAPAPVSKVGRPMNGERLERLKASRKLLKDAIGELKAGSVPLEKFDAAASELSAIISECDVAKFVEAAKVKKMIGAADVRAVSPLAANVGAGVQPDTSTVAGAEAVFGEGCPPEVAQLMKRLDVLEKRNSTFEAVVAKREKKIASLEGEIVSLKKFREAPSAIDEAEANEMLAGGDDEELDLSRDSLEWPTDMAAERIAELEEVAEDE